MTDSRRASSNPSTGTPAAGVPTGPRGTAVVTGASHRVGRAIALELARVGFGLCLTYRSRAAECEETARLAVALAASNGAEIGVRIDRLDLASPVAARDYAAALDASRGDRAIDCIVHNASYYGMTAFDALDAAAIEEAHRVEVVSPALVTKELRRALAASRLDGGGAVVLMGDMHADHHARAGFTPYMVAKAGVSALARQLAVELAPAVRVHCVAPGVIAWPDGFPADARTRILERTPLGRAGTPEEAARLVRFLVLEATYSTGSPSVIDGGRVLR
ncbi:MAG: SDR family NAD(P)-dependent oxidoreductase [Phycisphaerales bacterium]